jgi:beta-phosphoglucomutase-like phosphatase (HAD superfamily)
VSNAGRLILDANVDALGLGAIMDFTLSIEDVREGKPHPEPYASGCAQLGLDPRQVAAVEDSETGRRSAHAAGLLVIGYDHIGEMVTHADHVIGDLAKIPALLVGHRPATMPAGASGA